MALGYRKTHENGSTQIPLFQEVSVISIYRRDGGLEARKLMQVAKKFGAWVAESGQSEPGHRSHPADQSQSHFSQTEVELLVE